MTIRFTDKVGAMLTAHGSPLPPAELERKVAAILDKMPFVPMTELAALGIHSAAKQQALVAHHAGTFDLHLEAADVEKWAAANTDRVEAFAREASARKLIAPGTPGGRFAPKP
jgi:hypothetical protein